MSGLVEADTVVPSKPAQVNITPQPKPTFKDLTGIDLTGYLDTSYNYLVRSNHFTSGKKDREFDLEPNGFTLQQASITLAKQPREGFGGLLDVVVGRDAFTMASYGMNPNVLGIQNIGFDIPQLFLQYAKNSVTIIGGKFNTLTGEEGYDPTTNTNFSRSIIDLYAQPGTVTGFRVDYSPNNKITWDVGINNGWDNIRDTGRRKTIQLGVFYQVNSRFAFATQIYSGQERALDTGLKDVSNGPLGTRNLIDLVATFNATEKLSFAANADYLTQSKALLPDNDLARATALGIAGYINYIFNSKFRTSFRGEVFNDRNGFFTGVRQYWRELTLTLGYTPIKDLEFRLETRHDFSDVNSFLNKNGVTTSNNQQSFALEMLYQFT